MSLTVYGTAASGNCHKVRLALDILGRSYDWHEIDLMRGETRSASFLAMNPIGKVPVLALDDRTFLAESDAILWYLGEGTPLVPEDRLARARVLQWMFFEQYSHEPAIAVARFIRRFQRRDDDPRLQELLRRGDAALAVMEGHLATHDWFVGDSLTIADLALFAYTHRAADGGFELARYPAVSAWLARCRAVRGVTEMPNPA
jgi:glutathione S-transferase